MLPPVDENVFKANPEFGHLYKSLTGNILNPDGSTQNDAAAKKRDAVREELKTYRIKATRQQLLKHALATATPTSQFQPSKQRLIKSRYSRTSSHHEAPSSTQLPPELIHLLLLLPAFLEKASSTPISSLELLLSSSPFSDMAELLPQLSDLLSSHLISQARALARVVFPSTNPSFVHRSIPQLHSSTQALLSAIAADKTSLSTERLVTTSATVRYLNQHTEALVLLLRALEAKHGPVARETELRATEASLEARTWAVVLQQILWNTRHIVYPPEAQVALKNYHRHMASAKMRMSDSIRTREAELSDYGVGQDADGKERKLREMARVWREMEDRLKEIHEDLERLGKS